MAPRELLELNIFIVPNFFHLSTQNHFQLDGPADGVENWKLVTDLTPVNTLSVEVHRGHVDYHVGTVGKLEHNHNNLCKPVLTLTMGSMLMYAVQ